MHNEPGSIIRSEPMSRFQWTAVLICVFLNALDGFDVLAITFAAPGISKEWSLGPGALGIVISTGLVGMALGSLLLAPVADVIGRRPIILLCLLAMTAGMLLSATASDVYQLAAWRVLTGLGIGGILAAINSMVAEYSNDRYRDLCISANTVGYPIGGVLGGLMAAWLLTRYDWRAVFVFGGLVTLAILPLVWWRLPESIEFLAMQRHPDALSRSNAILVRMGHRTATRLAALTRDKSVPLLDIFRGELLSRTVLMSTAYFLHIMTFYYALGWIPSIVSAMGFSPAVGASVSVLTSLGGIVGGVALGYSAGYFNLKYLGAGIMLLAAALLSLFGHTQPDLLQLKIVAVVLGFFLFGGVASLYGMLARVYPTHARATGTGFAIGLGRVGGILGPTIGGWLMVAGVNRPNIAMLMALGSALAATTILLMHASLLAAPRRVTGK